ncbi:MAG: DUF1990 family protein, partial [Deltaproteobacteria bacterium]|nr:DUF1990 family protein [Deltaproteobacteria bacterium]
AFDLRFLCPVVVRAIRGADAQSFGYVYATLDGHLEAGQEWFLLTKDPASGEVRFRIEARWRPGQFPTWWSYVGFQLTSRQRQRAWHRLAHLRLRSQLAAGGASMPIPVLPSIRQLGRRTLFGANLGIELEQEQLRRERLTLAAALAATCGGRSLLAPALLARAFSRAPHPPRRGAARWLASRSMARVLAALSLGELILDLLPGVPSRKAPAPLVGRVATGGLVGYAVAAQGRRRKWGPSILGAASAMAGTFAFAAFRDRLGRRLPGAAAGLVEDVLVGAAASSLTTALGTEVR